MGKSDDTLPKNPYNKQHTGDRLAAMTSIDPEPIVHYDHQQNWVIVKV